MIDSSQEITIPLSRTKLLLMLAAAIAFVAIGIWFVVAPPNFRNQFWANRAFVAGIGSIVVFGLFAIFIVRKLGDRTPGLVVNEKGIVDNAGAFPAGEIAWDDVLGIEDIEMSGQRMVLVFVRDPQPFIDRHTNAVKRKIVTMNAQMVGTPISISANSLQIEFEELLALLHSRLGAHRR